MGDKIKCVITEIDKEKRRIAISHKLTIDNPYKVLIEKHPVGNIVEGIISSSNDYALYIKLKDYDIDAFLHCNDLSYTKDPETPLIRDFVMDIKPLVIFIKLK